MKSPCIKRLGFEHSETNDCKDFRMMIAKSRKIIASMQTVSDFCNFTRSSLSPVVFLKVRDENCWDLGRKFYSNHRHINTYSAVKWSSLLDTGKGT